MTITGLGCLRSLDDSGVLSLVQPQAGYQGPLNSTLGYTYDEGPIAYKSHSVRIWICVLTLHELRF